MVNEGSRMQVIYNDKTDILYIRLESKKQEVINHRVVEDVVLDIGEGEKKVGRFRKRQKGFLLTVFSLLNIKCTFKKVYDNCKGAVLLSKIKGQVYQKQRQKMTDPLLSFKNELSLVSLWIYETKQHFLSLWNF